MVRFLLLSLLLLSGCATLENGRGWGEDATLRPGWGHLLRSFKAAASSPGTWGPLSGAVLFQVTDWDDEFSDWASRKTPVFGSTEDADEWSTDLANTCQGLYYVSTLAVPSGAQPGPWTLNKLKGLAVGYAATESVSVATGTLKEATDRDRPNSANRNSFPSGHSSRAAAFATLTARNTDLLLTPGRKSTFFKAGIYSLSAVTAWARVEAKMHYPSDVLAGAALGHFLSLFIHDGFMGLKAESLPLAQVGWSRDGYSLGFSWRY